MAAGWPLTGMMRFVIVSAALASLVVACSGGEVAVGANDKTNQKLQTTKSGGATGNGSTCSWAETVVADTTTTAGSTSYNVGQDFKSPDGCNDCSCSDKGIMCTQRACSTPPSQGQACTDEAKQCPDGSYVGRTGPNCEFAQCPSGNVACQQDAKQCPDGSYVGRTGPKCEFVCPTDPVACQADAKRCPNGSYVSRQAPNCEFAPCP